MDNSPITLFGAARESWRDFVPVWVFPVFFLYGELAADVTGYPNLFFWLIAAPLFFWSFFRAFRPLREGRISYAHGVFWAMVVPFIIWAGAVFSRLAVIHMLGGNNAA